MDESALHTFQKAGRKGHDDPPAGQKYISVESRDPPIQAELTHGHNVGSKDVKFIKLASSSKCWPQRCEGRTTRSN